MSRVPTVREALASVMREKELQDCILELAATGAWLAYHTHDSRRSQAGFPDLVLVSAGRGRLIFAELKREKEKPTDAQLAWLDALETIGGVRFGVSPDKLGFEAEGMMPEVYVWRPRDWFDGTIARLLA